jgi:hypothetical protein
VIAKHSVFVRFAAAFGELLPAIIAEQLHVVNIFVAFDFVAANSAIQRNFRVHLAAFFKAVFHLLFWI